MKLLDSHCVGWFVNGKRFTNKLLALEEAQRSQSEITFEFFGEIFDQIAWDKEPEQSWPELLAQRARQLRDEYDYLRLFYSGGADSQTILNTFLTHHIFIDEIICYRYVPFGEKDHKVNSEINKVAIPFLRKFSIQLEKTKITILDLTPDRYQMWFSGHWFEKKAFLDYLAPDPQDIEHIFPDVLAVHDDKKKICHIQGGQKPRVRFENGEATAMFFDSHLMADIFGRCQENFYTTEKMPEVHVKQCHLLVNHYLKIGIDKLSTNDLLSPPNRYVNEACRDPLFQNVDLGKAPGLFSAKTLLFVDDPRLHQYTWAKDYLGFIQSDLNKEWFNDNNVLNNFKGIKTFKKYVLRSYL